jgi:hypothetical protein
MQSLAPSIVGTRGKGMVHKRKTQLLDLGSRVVSLA